MKGEVGITKLGQSLQGVVELGVGKVKHVSSEKSCIDYRGGTCMHIVVIKYPPSRVSNSRAIISYEVRWYFQAT